MNLQNENEGELIQKLDLREEEEENAPSCFNIMCGYPTVTVANHAYISHLLSYLVEIFCGYPAVTLANHAHSDISQLGF